MNAQEASRFADAFSNLDTLIESLKHDLPQIHSQNSITRRLIRIHTLAHIASIQIHSLFASSSNFSRARCFDSARSVVLVLDTAALQGSKFIDPIMGVSPQLISSYTCVLTLCFRRCGCPLHECLLRRYAGYGRCNTSRLLPLTLNEVLGRLSTPSSVP